MIKIAKQLDFYDDPKAEILRRRFPDLTRVPEIIKEGAVLSEKERERLPDDLFALVIDTGNGKIRKFACSDKANTALSVIYFLDHAKDKLPSQLQKVAASNLVVACRWYNMQPPEPLTKIAGKVNRKHIESVVKLNDIKPDEEEIKHANYCLPEEQKYPIHSYRQVLAAIDYFTKNASKFEPEVRRTYCKNLEKRASDLGIILPEKIREYASDQPSSGLAVREQLAKRMSIAPGEPEKRAYEILSTKLDRVPRTVFAIALNEIDKVANLDMQWDDTIDDPWTTCFQITKIAEYTFNDSTGYITEIDLNRLAEHKPLIRNTFDEDFANAFCNDPVQTFDALPLDQKRVIIKMVKAVKNA